MSHTNETLYGLRGAPVAPPAMMETPEPGVFADYLNRVTVFFSMYWRGILAAPLLFGATLAFFGADFVMWAIRSGAVLVISIHAVMAYQSMSRHRFLPRAPYKSTYSIPSEMDEDEDEDEDEFHRLNSVDADPSNVWNLTHNNGAM